jgi:hypothetical protein
MNRLRLWNYGGVRGVEMRECEGGQYVTHSEASARITALEEALRVLAARANLGIMCSNPDLCDTCRKIQDAVNNNPIAAEAVRKAGG